MDLDAMEKMAAEAAGETPQEGPQTEQGQEVTAGALAPASAIDIALLNKTEAEQIHILKATIARGLDKDDPVLDIYNAATSAARSAHATATAAVRVAEGVNGIPKIVQDAAFAGAGDVAGVIHQAFRLDFEDFKGALKEAIKIGTSVPVDTIIKSTKRLEDAVTGIDGSIDKAIIAKRDAVLSQWVQSGSDALDRRIREAIKTERTVNLAFMLFAIATALVVGIVLGMHLHF